MRVTTQNRRRALLGMLGSAPLTAAVLAARFEVSTGTIRRDVEAIRAAGHEVYSKAGAGYALRPFDVPVPRVRRGLPGDRQARMLEALGASDGPLSAAALGAELGVSTRTVYRYVDALRDVGAVIDGEPGVGYVLMRRPPTAARAGGLAQERRRAKVLAVLRDARVERRLLTSAAIAERVGVSDRTVLRDLAALRRLGLDVRVEVGVGCMLGAPVVQPLHLTAAEADALRELAGTTLADGDASVGQRRALRRAYGKLQAIVPTKPDFDYDDLGAGASHG